MPNHLISVVSPFFNEAPILEQSVALMMRNLHALKRDFELIIVNDGSRDGSGEVARGLVDAHGPNLRLVSYDVNQGRGYALRKGIEAARGDIIVTTEIDSSWGDTIVGELVSALESDTALDLVVASPHAGPGAGYRNVPQKRVMLSRWGNHLIRLLFHERLTMYTGMTRGYRASVIKTLPLHEKGKEFHLEVVLKALALGCNIGEIPCVLEWRHHKLAKPGSAERKSSSKIRRLISSHLFFSVMASPIRYLWGIAGACTALGLGTSAIGMARMILGVLAFHWFLVGGVLLILATLFFVFGVLASQNSLLQQEIWRLQRDVRGLSQIAALNPSNDE
jgi:glycosyltransferase involved in cell wall biosynthesis